MYSSTVFKNVLAYFNLLCPSEKVREYWQTRMLYFIKKSISQGIHVGSYGEKYQTSETCLLGSCFCCEATLDEAGETLTTGLCLARVGIRDRPFVGVLGTLLLLLQ